MIDLPLTRRALLVGAGTAGTLLLSGCDRLSGDANVRRVLGLAEPANAKVHRFLQGRHTLAPEYGSHQISPDFRANGTTMPGGDDYADAVAFNFADWRLTIDGLVHSPLSLSLAQIRRMPARTQITRHDCVEGWSAIGGWTGVQLGHLLQATGLKTNARYAVFHCADNLEGEPEQGGIQSPGQYYESIDLIDAFHRQTILAYAMNGAALPIAHGAPLRLRVERQLGYKQAKYVQRVEIVESLARFGSGKGGYWEDRGYAWYAGI
jgi:DMSO/TMAO reductase YedYZ molybdopterin-dependent catalytic subunit